MFKSMTAYGRATTTTSLGRFTAEIQSVNRKHLEINIVLSRELNRFEQDVRKAVSSVISRGHITVRIFAHFDQVSPISVSPNLPLARQLKQSLESIAKDLKISPTVTLEMLNSHEGIVSLDEEMIDEEKYSHDLFEILNQALERFNQMRMREGKALEKDILSRLEQIEKYIEQIALKAPTATERYRQKLVERLNEVLPGVVENEERIMREICIYAERVDIAEEITRFGSHLSQCRSLFQSNSSVGKTFEFLLQEMGREINTIGSKSSDMDISKLVIDTKSDLERIREQIQNIE